MAMPGFEGGSNEPGGGRSSSSSSSATPVPAAVGDQQLDRNQQTTLFRFMKGQKELHPHVQLIGLHQNRDKQQSCNPDHQLGSQRVELEQKRVLGHSHGQQQQAFASRLRDVSKLINLNLSSASMPPSQTSLPLSRELDCHASNNGHIASGRYWQAPSRLPSQQDLESSIGGTFFIEREKLLGQLSDQYGIDSEEKQQKKKKKIKPNSIACSDKQTSRRVCKYCDREFPSGRALGGHMRVHGAFFSDSSAQTSTMLKPVSSSSFKAPASGLVSSSSNTSQKNPTTSTNAFAEKLPCLPDAAGSHDQLPSNRFAALQPAPGSRPITNLSSSMKDDAEEADEEIFSDGDDDNCKAVAEGIRSMPLKKDQYLVARSFNELSSNEHGIDGLLSLGSKALISDASKSNSSHKLRRNPRVPQLDHINVHDLPSNMPDFLRKSEPPSPERARPCSECGKVFWSWKALFGHMRCHPEREWRGIQRPDGGFELERQAAVMKRSPTEQSFTDKSKPKIETDVEKKATGASEKPEKAMMSDLDLDMVRQPSLIEDRKANWKETGGEEAGCYVKEEGLISSMKSEVEEAPKLVGRNMKEEQATSLGEGAEEAKSPIEEGEVAASDGKQEEGYGNMAMEESSGEKERNGKRGRDSAFREITDDNSPSSWPTRRRSKRRRARIPHGREPNFNPEPGLTSETASDQELKGKASLLRDQEDLDMANCLVLLSGAAAGNRIEPAEQSVESTEESANSESGRMHEASEDCSVLQEADSDDGACDHEHYENQHMREDNTGRAAGDPITVLSASSTVAKYECSTCKRCFNSHQALGGHRASHRKMKGCFTKAALSEEAHEHGHDIIGESKTINSHRWAHQIISSSQRATSTQEQQLEASTLYSKEKLLTKKKIKGHQCSICHRIFPSGQALGGHKRCHWTGEKIADTASVASSSNKQPSTMQEKHDLGNHSSAEQPRKIEDSFDLNLPAPMEDEDEACFNTKEAPGYSRQVDIINGTTTMSGEQIVSPFVGYRPAMRSNASSICGNWVAHDVLRSNGDGSWMHPSRDLEARCRLDGSNKVWNQQWNNAVASQVPCMYTLQPL